MTAPAGSRRVVGALLVASAGLLSCGASIRALYESDVRFEHCMALDASAGVKPTLQRMCWEEWVRFYQYGQTRDRIDHARVRKQELGSASDFDDGEGPARVGVAPDPTSAMAPPPLMMPIVDGGPPEGGVNASVDGGAALKARCTSVCEDVREACRETCKRTPPCEAACAIRSKRCAARCEGPAQGSR